MKTHDTVERFVGDVIAMTTFLQSYEEPTVVELLDMVRMEDGKSFIASESAIEQIQWLMIQCGLYQFAQEFCSLQQIIVVK